MGEIKMNAQPADCFGERAACLFCRRFFSDDHSMFLLRYDEDRII